MRNKVIIAIAVLAITILIVNQFILGNYSKRDIGVEKANSQEPSKKTKTIGVVVHNMQHMFMANVAAMLREKSKEYDNVKLLLYDSEGRNDKQILQLEELIDLQVDGIILNPNDQDLVNDGVEEVRKAGIPLITLNMNVSSEEVNCYIGSNSVQAGEIQGRYIAEELNGKGNIVVLAGQKGMDATEERLQGLQNILSKYPGIRILEIAYVGWDKHLGAAGMKDILKKHKKIDAVASQNDEMLLGALPVLEQNRLNPVTIGVDAIPQALEEIKAGKMGATVYQDARSQALAAFDTMMRIFSNEQVEKVKNIPYELVMAKNADDYIRQSLIIK